MKKDVPKPAYIAISKFDKAPKLFAVPISLRQGNQLRLPQRPKSAVTSTMRPKDPSYCVTRSESSSPRARQISSRGASAVSSPTPTAPSTPRRTSRQEWRASLISKSTANTFKDESSAFNAAEEETFITAIFTANTSQSKAQNSVNSVYLQSISDTGDGRLARRYQTSSPSSKPEEVQKKSVSSQHGEFQIFVRPPPDRCFATPLAPQRSKSNSDPRPTFRKLTTQISENNNSTKNDQDCSLKQRPKSARAQVPTYSTQATVFEQDKQPAHSRINEGPTYRAVRNALTTHTGIPTKDLMDILSINNESDNPELERRLAVLRNNPGIKTEFVDGVYAKMRRAHRGARFTCINKVQASVKNAEKATVRKQKADKRNEKAIITKQHRDELLQAEKEQLKGQFLRWEAQTVWHNQKKERVASQKLRLVRLCTLAISGLVWGKRFSLARQKTKAMQHMHAMARIIQRACINMFVKLAKMRLGRVAERSHRWVTSARLNLLVQKLALEEQKKAECMNVIKKFLKQHKGEVIKRPIHNFLKRIRACQRLVRHWIMTTHWRVSMLVMLFDKLTERLDKLRRKTHLERLRVMKQQDIKDALLGLSKINAELNSTRKHEHRKHLQQKRNEASESMKMLQKVYGEAANGACKKENRRVLKVSEELKQELCRDLLRQLRYRLEARRRSSQSQKAKHPKYNHDGITIDIVRKMLFHDDNSQVSSESPWKIKEENSLSDYSKAYPVLVLTNTSKDAMFLLIILGERLTLCQEGDIGKGFVRLELLKDVFIKYAPPSYTEEDCLTELQSALPFEMSEENGQKLVDFYHVLEKSRNKIWNVLLDGLEGDEAHLFSTKQPKH